MHDEDKPKVVTGTFNKEEAIRAQALKAMRTIRENWADHLEYLALDAQMRRAKYLALLKEGFTESQAIELCK